MINQSQPPQFGAARDRARQYFDRARTAVDQCFGPDTLGPGERIRQAQASFQEASQNLREERRAFNQLQGRRPGFFNSADSKRDHGDSVTIARDYQRLARAEAPTAATRRVLAPIEALGKVAYDAGQGTRQLVTSGAEAVRRARNLTPNDLAIRDTLGSGLRRLATEATDAVKRPFIPTSPRSEHEIIAPQRRLDAESSTSVVTRRTRSRSSASSN
jgi:hypothetical protein